MHIAMIMTILFFDLAFIFFIMDSKLKKKLFTLPIIPYDFLSPGFLILSCLEAGIESLFSVDTYSMNKLLVLIFSIKSSSFMYYGFACSSLP